MATVTYDKDVTALLVIDPYNDFIVALDWGSSGFANTDLDLQLKRHGVHQLIVIGLIAHTCVKATVRFAAELGYEVTVVKEGMSRSLLNLRTE